MGEHCRDTTLETHLETFNEAFNEWLWEGLREGFILDPRGDTAVLGYLDPRCDRVNCIISMSLVGGKSSWREKKKVVSVSSAWHSRHPPITCTLKEGGRGEGGGG